MAKKNRRPSAKKTAATPITSAKKGALTVADLHRLEFHRNALALMPDPRDKRPGIAIRVDAPRGRVDQQFCTCSTARSRTCSHLKELSQVVLALQRKQGITNLSDDFKSSIWYRLASVLAEGLRETPQTIRMMTAHHGDQEALEVFSRGGDRLLVYFSRGMDRHRFLERCTLPPADGAADGAVPTRAAVIQRISLLTLTPHEELLMDQGLKTRRQVMEESFWHKLAYHGYRELGTAGGRFHAAVAETSGEFVVTCRDSADQKLFALNIPRKKVKRVLNSFKELLCNHHGLAIHPIPLDSLFDVKLNDALDIEVRPLVRLIQQNGEAKFFERKDLKRFQYGDLYYIKELGILAEDQYPHPPPARFREPVKTVIQRSQVPSFLEEFETDLKNGAYLVDDQIKRLKIFKQFERIEITPAALDRDWCWLAVSYGAGNQAVSLAEILRAKQAHQRFIATAEGWIDCQAPDLEPLDALLKQLAVQPPPEGTDRIRLKRADIFRIAATSHKPPSLTGAPEPVAVLEKLLELKPSRPLPDIKGMTSVLRAYQQRGTEWLWFLFENRFGGLLCDDMGLGKTHQVMALMACLREQAQAPEPFLVVCPTTVISHWENKIREHAPGLKTAVYYGNQRDLQEALRRNDVVLTSYGILRRNTEILKPVHFAVAVFDEIQNIKNPLTQAYGAAEAIDASMKIGLTGTPIENSLIELKALMDLAVPGYLGSTAKFIDRYLNAIEQDQDVSRRKELSRLISPFTLRRMKGTVLKELPEKIEDLRTCRLSEDQVKLYRDAVAARGRGLREVLEKGQEPVPYMHIFALLNLLKQICNHPALVEKKTDDYVRYESGKWDLFTELLAESLDSGQKVVVYSQYLAMIEIIKKHLAVQQVGFASLTGASRNRGDIIARFADDPACRVFVGSLKAGGTGIDLVAASVVIHYDRWWNAAREDQATDRVHRIGQRRGVQVFKLVTAGTLEEKIAALIAKKRNLMEDVVQEDDPGLLKAFNREELIDLLSMPGEATAPVLAGSA
ncbi:MAG: DEAD/DEAH box helicase [Desulfobacterales bacterium]|nr:MAG: DEAD/DEAH box helicase [Desulfobacterales bacterium]